MANYICQPLTPKVSSRYISKVTVPASGLVAGNVIVADTINNAIFGNFEVYTATPVSDANLNSNFMALVLNDGFENLSDGRRPDGQPNYYEYEFKAGDTAPIMYISNHLKFNIGLESINPTTIGLAVEGNYLVPVSGSLLLNAVETIPSGVNSILKILGTHNTPIGGLYGGGFATSLVCVGMNFADIDSGSSFYSFTVPNQVGETVIDETMGSITLSVAGARNNLVATFTNSIGSTVTVGGVEQISGVTANDFTSPIIYSVESETGVIHQYEVSISLAKYSLEVSEDLNVSDVSVKRNGVDVAVGPDALTYGDVITISGGADPGYSLQLSVNGEEFTSGNTITVSSDIDVVATTTPVAYVLMINNTNATTTVTRAGVTLEDGDNIYQGDELTITSVPVDPATTVTITVNDSAFTSGDTYTVVGNTTINAIGA